MPRTPGREAPTENAPALPPVAEQLGEIEVISVTVDTSGLRMGDLKLLARLRRGEGGDEEALELLNRVVVGGVDHLPFDAQPGIWAAVWQGVYGGKTRKN